jgi:uncharacterized membrane protein
MMRRIVAIGVVFALLLAVLGPAGIAWAQEQQPQAAGPDLVVFTRYPAQISEIGKTVTFPLTLQAGTQGQTVRLTMRDIPEGWTATFRGGGKLVQAVYVQPDDKSTVDLKLEPPKDVEPGTYRFVVVAQGEGDSVELPVELTIKDKLPPSLSFTSDLPTLKGSPTSSFRYSATLKNEGDEDLTVNLVADAPNGFLITFKASGKEVTSFPLEANQSKRLDIELKPFAEIPAGSYPFTVLAQGGEAEARLELTAEVTGQPELKITTPDGRLSGQAYAGKDSSLKLTIQNTGSAPALGVELSANEPSGWSVEFEPKKIAEIQAGKQVEVTAKIRPADKAVAGDYMLTLRATPETGSSKSAEFRITVLTSTLWGVVGVGLIAVAVGVVALAVMRFGRR